MHVRVPGSQDPILYYQFSSNLNELEPSRIYEFDFCDVEFVTPGWMMAVGSALRAFKAKLPNITRRAINYRHLGYASHVGFFKYFGLDYGLQPSQAPGSDSYIPITEVQVSTILERAAELHSHPGEIVEGEARRIATLLTRVAEGPVFDTLSYSIREIVRNVIEHSDSPTYSIIAQYWPTRGEAEFAVCDSGKGIMHSLKENPRLSVDKDIDAIRLSLLPGISSKAWKRQRTDNIWANSGYGLFMTQKLCSVDGQFTLLSGTSGITMLNAKAIELRTASPGTLVVLRLAVESLGELGKRLASFRTEGQILAKKVAGASVLGPSLASQLLKPNTQLTE